MKTFLRISTILLLLFNSFGALYGGLNLILHPDGSSMHMSPDLLEHSPFQNYLIPGVILFVMNGLFSIFISVAILLRFKSTSWLVLAQGVILVGWIFIQILLIQVIIPLHWIMGSVGIALILLGWYFIINEQNGTKRFSGFQNQ